jgi:hypothetical protein
MGLFAALSIMTLSIFCSNELRYAEFHYAECCKYLNIMLSVFVLSVVMLSVVMLSVVMLSVVMLSAANT